MTKIGQYIVRENLCDEEAVARALEQQAALKAQGRYKPLGAILVDSGRVSFEGLDRCLKKMHVHRLAHTTLFRGMPKEDLEKLVEYSATQILPPDTVIFQKGALGDAFYVLISGRVKAYVASADGVENALAFMEPGQAFGEIGFLTGQPRSASAKSLEPTCLLIVSRKYFLRDFGQSQEAMEGFIRVLADRVYQENEALVERAESERAFQNFIGTRARLPHHPMAGTSRAMKKLRKQFDDASSSTGPVLLCGETGTMKTSLAKTLHNQSAHAGGPFLDMDPLPESLDSPSEAADRDFRARADLEVTQYAALFGNETGTFPLDNTKRPGLLEICRNGTVVVKNIERLAPGVQERLFEFIESGGFHPIGSARALESNARVVATTSADLKALVQQGLFSRRLFESFDSRVLAIPALREHKKDLKDIVQEMIARFNAQMGKQVRGMDPEAFQRIMAYDWPGNMGELSVVVRRAVSLAEQENLLAEDIFLGMAPPEGKLVLNLLKFDRVRGLFSHRFFPVALQSLTALFFVFILLLTFFGNPSPEKNISLILAWALWWPMVVASWFLGARAWCGVCPMGAVSGLISRNLGLGRKPPRFIKKYGLHLSALGLVAIFWVEAASHMSRSPLGTGILLLSITLAAAVSGMVYQRRLWCRYLCPLGRLCGVFSTCSVVEWRANTHICNTVCKTPLCYKGNGAVPGCPLYQGPFSLRSNQNCLLCGNCVKTCEHQSPAFNLRLPGHEIWAMVKPENATTLFAPVIIGTQIFRCMVHAPFLSQVGDGFLSWVSLAVLMAVSILGAFVLLGLSGRLFLSEIGDPAVRKPDIYSYGLLPLALCFELAYHMGPLLTRFGKLPPVLGRQIGVDLTFLDFSSALGSALPWQFLMIFAGSAFSLMVLARLAFRHQKPPHKGFGWKKGLPVFFLAALYLFSFVTHWVAS